MKTYVFFLHIGSPASPATKDIRVYLKRFLLNPYLIDLPRFFWRIILYCFILPFRPREISKNYKKVWNGKEFLQIEVANKFLNHIIELNEDKNVHFHNLFILPLENYLDEVKRIVGHGQGRIKIVSMYPQYSKSSIGFVLEKLEELEIDGFSVEIIKNFHRSHAFIDSSVQKINQIINNSEKKIEKLYFSFHGIPKEKVIYKNEEYYLQCVETTYLLNQFLNIKGQMCFQSRFGNQEWLLPYTDQVVPSSSENTLAIYCPSFVTDCLETVDEIGIELVEETKASGKELYFVSSLNDTEDWTRSFLEYIVSEKKKEYEIVKENLVVPDQSLESPPLSKEAKTCIKIVFLTLFLDLVGFSIIFPLFPALAEYYLKVDGNNVFLKFIFESVTSLTNLSPESASYTPIVLFGGALGAIYSLLQFIAAPIWGNLSDKIGRKKVMTISLIGLAISYFLWIISGSFTVLILARFIGGIMAGNISTATAIVADVTTIKNRGKGMAFVGIAFAFGFIFGPALGGILSKVNLLDYYPNWESFGINPFSVPAILAFVLTVWNIYYVYKKLPETLKKRENEEKVLRSNNPLKLFSPLPIKNVNITNLSYFLFISAFSGMEFTLTFLAVERLSFTPLDNGYMFIFIGLIIALVQGGYVRRKASKVGEKKIATMGLIAIIPGLLFVAFSHSVFSLYIGLFFLAMGSAMIIPCLTALVSIYTPESEQGKSLGIFRSLGAFGRVIGPIFACILYWQGGSSIPYIIGAVFMIIPLFLLSKLTPKTD